jgi:kynureninase
MKKNDEAYARSLDASDPLARFRGEFLLPKGPNGEDCVYLTGNSLGLQPRKARPYIEEELEDWARFGVEGHFHGRHPWLPYHENLTASAARLVGALPTEVVVMNTLSVNLHLMMVSFYRPTRERFKILVEAGAFPSDQYAVASQARFHGFDPAQALLEVAHDEAKILETLAREGKSVALVLLGNVNYLTGYAFDMAAITRAAHAQGCRVGFDLAHGAGNLPLRLHDDGPDFAVWCGYKYLNGGPGTLAGCFVHERHARAKELPRFAGWWGQNKATRFKMGPVFDPIEGAEGWQLSNPPIFQMAAMRASLELFDAATMPALRAKSERLTAYLESLLDELPRGFCELMTPRDPARRGCQLSLRIPRGGRELIQKLGAAGVICDFREPDIVRAAPVPLYNTFHDAYRFAEVLKAHARQG